MYLTEHVSICLLSFYLTWPKEQTAATRTTE